MLNGSQQNEFSNGNLNEIALRLRMRMKQLNLSPSKLGRRCETYCNLDESLRPNLSRERIAKILMNAQPRIGKGAAKVISKTEILVLADILGVAPEWLANQTDSAMLAFWDFGSNPKYANQVAHLLSHYEEITGESLVWGDNLLCSLTPPEFAHIYHQNYFAEYGLIGLHEQKRIMVEIYDRVGDSRRREILNNFAKRRYTITQIIFRSEFQKIVDGSGNYSGINRSLRQRCLKSLAEFVLDEKYKVRLIIVCDEKALHLKSLLRDYDRFGVNGDKFSAWSYHYGKFAWSEDKNVVLQHRKIVEKLMERSVYGHSQDTARFILEMANNIHN